MDRPDALKIGDQVTVEFDDYSIDDIVLVAFPSVFNYQCWVFSFGSEIFYVKDFQYIWRAAPKKIRSVS